MPFVQGVVGYPIAVMPLLQQAHVPDRVCLWGRPLVSSPPSSLSDTLIAGHPGGSFLVGLRLIALCPLASSVSYHIVMVDTTGQ